MMRGMLGALVSFAFASPALAEDVTKEDVLKLARAGVGEGVILAFLDSHQARIHLSSDEVIELTKAGVSERVVRHLLEMAKTSERPPVPEGIRVRTPVLPPDGPRTGYIPTGRSTYSYVDPTLDSGYPVSLYYSSHYPYPHHYETHHFTHYNYSFSPHLSGVHSGHHGHFGGHHGHH